MWRSIADIKEWLMGKDAIKNSFAGSGANEQFTEQWTTRGDVDEMAALTHKHGKTNVKKCITCVD
jgi:hypothetical protein